MKIVSIMWLPNYLAGLLAYKNKKFKVAQTFLEKATSAYSNHAHTQFKLGMAYFKQEKWLDAKEAFEKAVALDFNKPSWSRQLNQAIRHLGGKEDGGLAKVANDILLQIKNDPTNNRLYKKLADVYQKQKNYPEEVAALKMAIQLGSNYASWYTQYANALENIGAFSEAANAFDMAIKMKKNKAPAEWYYRQGYCYEREGHDGQPNPQAAQKAYQTAIEKDTKLSAKRFGIGVFHQARGHWEQAASAYQNQINSNPLDAELHYRLGMAYVRCYQWQQAQECYQTAIALDPEQMYWHYRLGFVFERQEHYTQAEQAYHYAAINRDTHTPYWFYRWAYVLEQQGKHQQAAEAYLQTRKTQTLPAIKPTAKALKPRIPTDPVARFLAALTKTRVQDNRFPDYMHQQQDTEKQILLKQLEKDTTLAEHWYKLGNLYEYDQAWSQAAEAYTKAIENNLGYNHYWFYRLGYCYLQLEEYEKACDALRKQDFFEGDILEKNSLFGQGINSKTTASIQKRKQVMKQLKSDKRWIELSRLWQVEISRVGVNKLNPYQASQAIHALNMADKMEQAQILIDALPDKVKETPQVVMSRYTLVARRAKMRWWMNYEYDLPQAYGSQLSLQEWLETLCLLESLRKLIDGKRKEELIRQEIVFRMFVMNAAYESREFEVGIRVIKDAFELFAPQSRDSLEFLVAIEGFCITFHEGHDPSVSDDACWYIENFVAADFNVLQWFLLEKVLAWNGLLKASYKAREKAFIQIVKLVLREDTIDFYEGRKAKYWIELAIKGVLEFGWFEKYDELINYSNHTYGENYIDYSLVAYAELIINGDVHALRNYYLDTLPDKTLYNALNDKSLAIVGPAPTEFDCGGEIDSFDFTVRLNSPGLKPSLDQRKYGSKIDVVSFNNEKLKQLYHTNQKPFSEHSVSYVLHLNPPRYSYKWLDNKINLARSEKLVNFLGFANPNHIPNLLFSVINYGPKNIKLFSMNFFLSQQAYDNSYRDGSSLAKLVWGDNLAAGFAFVKRMYEVGLVDVDAVCEPVITLSVEDYMKSMESIYLPAGSVRSGDLNNE